MIISCDPVALKSASQSFENLTASQRLSIQTYLLAVLAGGSLDPSELLYQARCFACLTQSQNIQVQNLLLCEILRK